MKYQYWIYMAWKEIIIRYRRSVLGPFWITASTGIYVLAVSVVFSALFNQELKHYVLYMTIGIIIWNFLNQTFIDATDAFIANSGFIKQVPLEKSVFIYQTVMRNLFFLLHNLVLIVICFFYSETYVSLYSVGVSLFWFVVLTYNVICFSFFLSCLCVRFMDLRQIVYSILQVTFLITPIMWMPNQGMRDRISFLSYNPVYHFIDLIRQPLLPTSFPELYLSSSISYIAIFTVFNSIISFLVFSIARKNIAYWV